jgi:hypothetical protein
MQKKTPIEANDFHRVPVSPGPQIKKSETTTAASTQTIQIVKHIFPFNRLQGTRFN